MHKYYISLLLVRLVLPLALLLSIALRPFGLSLIYLLLYLIAPFPQVPDSQTFKGWRGNFLLLNIVVSVLLLLVHTAWHSVLAAFGSYGSLLEQYPIIQEIGQNLGLVSYRGIDPLMAVHFLAPELIMTFASLVVYMVVRKLLIGTPDDEVIKKDSKHQSFPLLTSAGKYIALFLIMFSGIMRPSVTSGIYYLTWLGAATAWSLGKPLERGFAVVSRCLMAIMAAHVAVLLVYQCSWLINIYPPENDFARYFGLTKLVILNETLPSTFSYEVSEDHMWATLASPFVILVAYYFLAVESRELFKPKAKKKSALTGIEAGKNNGALMRGVSFHRSSRYASRDRWKSATKKVRLIRNMSPSKKWSSIRSKRQLHQDSTGSVVVPDEESLMEDEEPTLLDEILAAIVDFFQVLIRSSYIATTITMMAWSILYHSWLTFVLLMWANIVWLCQDQRSFMLKTSPVLVCYAMLLLLAQYIYGMDLLESELPSNITAVNLQQIGLGREAGEACVPLLVKSVLACMFWVTLRQRVTELRTRRRSALVANMAAPLHLTASTAASAIEGEREDENRSRLLVAVGEWLRGACARYWIYVVVIMLFVIGITGERMTIFRITYMFLFLVFILMLQISWYWWRRLMYVFWITLIIYSMINLILIYIYQFDNFSKMIETYLMINERLQHDLGLDTYHKADLFVKLLTPTLFLIITIMQVHYFHKDFMALSDPKTRTESLAREIESRRASQAGASTIKDDLPALPLEEEQEQGHESPAGSDTDAEHSINSSVNTAARRSIHRKSSRSRSIAATASGRSGPSGRSTRTSTALRPWLLERARAARRLLEAAADYAFIFLDIHLVKIIFIALMLLCILNVSAIHVPIMLLISPALLLNPRKQRICILLISILISVYFMAKMVYQIEYIKHSFFDVNCTATDGVNITTYNNAEWVGFVKSSRDRPLVVLLKGYIALIALITFYSLVNYRQRSMKAVGLLPNHKETLMFPEITRADADKDLIHCIKFFFNYGFYKFGVEISLICLMGVVGSRMDAVAAFYACWLLALVGVRRARLPRLWPAFTGCLVVLLPLQYMLALGFLPQLCVQYPWTGEGTQMKQIRTWFYLPYADEPPYAVKLIFDYFLLMFAARQLRVFRIEKSQGDSYPGGSNSEEIGKNWETPNFVNPVPDFLGYVGTWLDVIKRMVFLGMLWVTLAIMFMTGTNRVNLFSMGYLIGSFIFLWQGTDFYLRPKDAILQWWSWLVRYNVCVVGVKTLLQIPGCMFSEVLQEHACWLVQLLGIGCIDKFAGRSVSRFLKVEYVKDSPCMVPQEDIGLAWDGVCFAFLILQKRLFHSYYFYRVIDESKATTVLASRGADLIEELRQKQMLVQEEQEVKILEKIKVKMERIKANQKKIQGAISKEPGHHDRAVRSGDYYMFDEFDDTELHMKDDESSSDEENIPKELGFGKSRSVLSRADGDADGTVTDRSRAGPSSDIDDFAPPPEDATFIDKMKAHMDTAGAFISSILVSLTRHVMRYSRDYRYVSRTLSVEKKILKEKEGFGIGIREGSQMIWEPLPETTVYHKDVTTLEEQDESMFKQGKSPLLHLLYALWYAILAHTDIVCYLMVFINQIQSATILSIPLPLMVFLWGTLSIPRPTKTFWVTLIAYTEVIVLIKSMFQFEILPWNIKAVPANNPFTAPRIIGIERKHNYALYDLLLLLIIFLHRFMLKSLGLWKEATPELELQEDMEYSLSPEDTQMLVEGKSAEVGKKYVQLHEGTSPYHLRRVMSSETHRRRTLRHIYSSRLSHEILHSVTALHQTQETNDRGERPLHEPHTDTPQSLLSLALRVLNYLLPRQLTEHADSLPASNREPDGDNQQLMLTGATGIDEEPGPSKLPEDDHYKVNDDQEPIIAVTTNLEDNYKHYPQMILLSVKRYLRPTRRFFMRMLAPGARVTADIYAYMFLCDFLNFLVVIFGFAAFGTHQGDGGVQTYLEENKVPIPFLVMLILQFGLIVVDRALYLRKFMLGKILFQYILIIGVHIWMFFVLPFITERKFNALLPPPMWYMVKCVYLLLSAYQIRCGYPRRIIGNFLCKSYRFLNMICFRGFMAVPFLFELRTLMDWIWTDTSMTLMDWLKMEDIFASVFLLKCSRYVEDKFPQPRGAKKSSVSKYMLGGGVLAFVIAIIWFPLVFFAFGNSVGKPNPPTDVTVNIRIGPFLPVYQMSAQSHNIDVYTEQEYLQLSNLYLRDRTAQTFLSNYMYNDVAVITINPNSTMEWVISPPELARLEQEARSKSSLSVKFTYVITHPSTTAQNPPTIEDHREVPIDKPADRTTLLRLLNGTATADTWITVKTLFPKFVKVFNKGTTKPAYQLMPRVAEEDDDQRYYRDVKLRLEREGKAMYWRVEESCEPPSPKLSSIPKNDCNMLVMYTFNDKLFPETLNFISGGGIIGLYTTFVFLASRMLRGFFSGIYTKIMFDDLPNVDRVLQLCLDIYLVREALELALEEDLFAKLVFLYRSPETMIKWSRPKDEEQEQRALPAPN